MKIIQPSPPPPVGEALRVLLVDQEIVVLGPGAIGFSMTLPAARHTRDRLGQLLAKIPDPNA
jgi:hypothetical protein